MVVQIVEPVPIERRLLFTLRDIARWVYHFPGRRRFRRSLSALRRAAPASPKLNFGWTEAAHRSHDAGIGGAVKLEHLRERFGESPREFNVLYVVSSILHLLPYPEELVAWAKRNRVAVIWNQNGVAYPAWCGSFYPWFNAPMRKLLHQADYVIYQSAFCRASADRYLGSVTKPAEILFNPVDVEHFSPSARPPDTSQWRLLAMGTSHAFYRVKASLDCLAILRQRGYPARLTIAGEFRWASGDAEASAYIDRLRLAPFVTRRPPFTQLEAPGIYRDAHVLLHPKYKDPCPTVPIEALACALPVVGSNSGGMPELVTPDAGVLVPTPDDWTFDHAPEPSAMADAVRRIMDAWPSFRAAARARAIATFDRKRWVDRHETVFRTLRIGHDG